MADLEELKKKKEQLVLEREIASLERKKKLEKSANSWSWFWVAPLGIVGVLVFLRAINYVGPDADDPTAAPAVIISLAATFPLVMKLIAKFRSQ